jgi:hypothetical protein
MKETFLLDDGTWSIGDKPDSANYDGLVHVLEDGVWSINDTSVSGVHPFSVLGEQPEIPYKPQTMRDEENV